MKANCLICDQNKWISYLGAENFKWDKLSLETSLDTALEPIHAFQEMLSKFTADCDKCRGFPIVCLLGRTGSGKSTILNILANCKPKYRKSNLGTTEIYFTKGVTEVGGGIKSLTKFCFCHIMNGAVYIDFAGFFDNRAGQLQVLQHLLLHHITKNRKFKILAVKDLRTSRDLPFIEFLNLDWITKKNTIVVMTQCNPDHEFRLDQYAEGMIKKNLKVVMMPAGVQGDEFKNFKEKLSERISSREFSNGEIRLAISAEVFKFQEGATKQVRKVIDTEFSKLLCENLPKFVMQPYNVEYVFYTDQFRHLFSSQLTVDEALVSLKDSGIISPKIDFSVLEKYIKHWTLLQQLTEVSGKDILNWGQITPKSADCISAFQRRMIAFAPPHYEPFEGKDLVADLRVWNSLCHNHYLEHVSYRSRALTLIASGGTAEFFELERLAIYRQENYNKLVEIWEPLEKKFLEAMKSEVDSSESNFIDHMHLRSTSKIVEEVQQFAHTGKTEMAERAKVIAQKLSGIAMADGAIATSAWALKIGAAATGTRMMDFLPGLGVYAGVIFGVAAAGAAGAFAYHMYMTSKQLQKIRAIGLDLSFLRVEASVWAEIEAAAKSNNKEGVQSALSNFEREFRLFINSTSQGILNAKSNVMKAKLKGVDVAQWEKLIGEVDKMARNIFVEMKAKERSALGCHFHEHDWVGRSILSVKMELFTRSCCKFYVTKMSLECRHCGFLSHKSDKCKMIALQTPCKSFFAGQDAENVNTEAFDVIQMNQEVFKEALEFSLHQDLVTASYLSSLVYDDNVKKDEQLFVHTEGMTKCLISTSGTTAFVIVRGTVVNSLQNWVTNSSAILQEYEPGSPMKLHAGFLKTCNTLFTVIMNHLSTLSCNRIVFGGHSLGGAIAHALHFKTVITKQSRGISTFSVGFGSPLVFNSKVAKEIELKGGKLENFVTYVNEHDPVPSIIQKAGSRLVRDLVSVVAPGFTSAVVGLISKEMTKDYQPIGKYVFFYSENKTPSEFMGLEATDTLNDNTKTPLVEFHEMKFYHTRLVAYLNKLEIDQSSRFSAIEE